MNIYSLCVPSEAIIMRRPIQKKLHFPLIHFILYFQIYKRFYASYWFLSTSCLQNQYKAEYDETMKGVGWLPLGSLEAEKNKKAMEIVSEKKYRQHPDKLKYSVPMDSMNMVLALNNAKIMDEVRKCSAEFI